MKKFLSLILSLIACFMLFSCDDEESSSTPPVVDDGDPYEYKEVVHIDDNNRVFYEIFVGAFADSNGDGMGDLRGVINKLDYLNDGNDDTHDDLGITGIWLMPICPSPTYHKYDVTDYYAIDPAYGTMADFEELAKECKKRDIKLIVDLVLNHTSSQHPWFIESKGAKMYGTSSPYKDWYVYSNQKINGYHQIGTNLYYEGVFWSGMPDLNMDSASLREEVKKIADFWIEKGAEGFRLDAAKHVYGTIDKNIEFWKWFNDYLQEKHGDIYTVAEIWSSGGEIKMYYDAGFTSVFNYVAGNTTGKIVALLNSGAGISSPENFSKWVVEWNKDIKSHNANAVDSPFITNHDNDRAFGALRRNFDNAKMAALVYLTMPGSPFIYYGEEIGMLGSGIDENKRLAMLWSTSGNCKNPANADWMDQICDPVNFQVGDYESLLHVYRMAIRLRAENPEIGRGEMQVINTGISDVCAWKITYNGKSIALVHNLSFLQEDATFTLPGATLNNYVSVLDGKPIVNGDQVTVPGYCTAVFALN